MTQEESSQRGPRCFLSILPYYPSWNLFLIIFQSFLPCLFPLHPSYLCPPLLLRVADLDFCPGFFLTFTQKLKIIFPLVDKNEQNASRMIFKKRSFPKCLPLSELNPSHKSLLNWLHWFAMFYSIGPLYLLLNCVLFYKDVSPGQLDKTNVEWKKKKKQQQLKSSYF